MLLSTMQTPMAAVAATVCLLARASAPARAGECAQDSVVLVGNGSSSGPAMPEGVTDTVLASTDLAGWIEAIGNRKLHVRAPIIQPGGIVPWHGHRDRPALTQAVRGAILEHRSTCAVPVLHKAGEVSVETKHVMRWGETTGSAGRDPPLVRHPPRGPRPERHVRSHSGGIGAGGGAARLPHLTPGSSPDDGHAVTGHDRRRTAPA